jgi:hypothetical protein
MLPVSCTIFRSIQLSFPIFARKWRNGAGTFLAPSRDRSVLKMTTVMKRLVVALGVIAGFSLSAPSADAASILFAVNVKIEGPSVAGDQTVATLRFDDFGANQVKLTVQSSLNAATEFLSDLAFNVKPSFTPSAITASYLAGSQVGAFQLPGLLRATQNAQNPAGPTTGYDFNFAFTTSNAQQGAKRFNLGDSFQYLFSAPGLTAEDFDVASAASHFAYAHVQGIGGDGSAGYGGKKASVPEPTSVLLLMIGAGAAFARARKA